MELRGPLPFSLHDERIIQIWSIGKPICVNSCRSAVVAGKAQVIQEIRNTAGWIYGALDAASLSFALFLINDEYWYARRTATIADLVHTRFSSHVEILGDTATRWIKPEAGYLSLALIDTSSIGRYRLYSWAIRNHVHAMFSSHVGLHRTAQFEAIRINHLLDVSRTLQKLADFLSSVNYTQGAGRFR
jgi:hypothetical protein